VDEHPEPARPPSKAADPQAHTDRVTRGRNWGNVAAGFTAICALAVSAYTAYLQRQQVKAQAWPRLSWDFESARGDKASFSFVLRNVGVGPALVRAVEVDLDGHPVRRWREVLDALAPSEPGHPSGSSTSDFHGRVLSAGETLRPFAPADPEAARVFISQASRVSVSLCYCSVLEDCWTLRAVGDRTEEAVAVARCTAPSVPFEN
jgi:hypothetical protein